MIWSPLAPVTAAVGACLGSFLTTAALRSVRGESPWGGRSHCDACGVGLSYFQTAPLVSFVRLRGSCAACGGSIDPVHLMGEALGAVVVGASFLVLPMLQASLVAALGLALLAASIVDAKTCRLPDPTTLAVGACAAGLALASGISPAAIGLCAATMTLLVLEGCRRGFARARGRAGLGFGDVKLAAALALWLGTGAPWMIVAASIGGLGFYALARPTEDRIPFGPFIAAAAWIIGFGQEAHWWPSPI